MIVYTNRYPYWLNGYHTMPEKQPHLALTSLGMVPGRRNQNIFLSLYSLFPTWETIAFWNPYWQKQNWKKYNKIIHTHKTTDLAHWILAHWNTMIFHFLLWPLQPIKLSWGSDQCTGIFTRASCAVGTICTKGFREKWRWHFQVYLLGPRLVVQGTETSYLLVCALSPEIPHFQISPFVAMT